MEQTLHSWQTARSMCNVKFKNWMGLATAFRLKRKKKKKLLNWVEKGKTEVWEALFLTVP